MKGPEADFLSELWIHGSQLPDLQIASGILK